MSNSEASQEVPRCPICGHLLEVALPKREGWLISYPVATCPHCGAQMEIKEDTGGMIKAVRFLLIPEETASFWPRKGWEALKGFIPYDTAQRLGNQAYQRVKEHREITRHFVEDEPPLCTSPLPLKRNEVCIYVEEHGVLAMRRDESKPLQIKEEGTLVVTDRSIYVGNRRFMWNKISDCQPTATGMMFRRMNVQSRYFIQAENPYAFHLAIWRANPDKCPQPTIESRKFEQGPSTAAKYSIPIPWKRGKRVAWTPGGLLIRVLILLTLLFGLPPLVAHSGIREALIPPTPTPTFTPTSTATPTATATPTPRYSPTPKPTATRMPTRTPTPTPTITPSPTPTPRPTAIPAPAAPPPPTATPLPVCAVEAWVNNPNPPQNSTIIVFGKLTCDGIGVANAAMHTVWHYKSTTPTCDGTTGGDGVAACQRPIGRATVGYFVRIDVSITWNGRTYYTSTGFTPQ